MKLVPVLLCGLIALDGAAGTRADTGSPFALGMDKRVALELAGPGAIAGVLCGGMDAVMIERGADSAMAGFVDGRVREIEAIAGAPPKCRDSFERDFAAAVARWGAPLQAPVDGVVGTARTRTAEFRVRGGHAELVERRFPGGACDVRLLVRAAGI